MHPTLYIVSTPIGNLEDITLRAVRILKEVDLIAAEDTRHSMKLLSSMGISKPMISYWSEKEKSGAEDIIKQLKQGRSIAIISDAGTPGISDPGTVVVKRAVEEGFRIVPVPGPSALTAAISISGLSSDEFLFIGFLPQKVMQRRKKLETLQYENRTMIFYEAPHRIEESVSDMLEVFGERKVVVCRELTKLHEEIFRGSLSIVMQTIKASKIAGEYVVVVDGAADARLSVEDALREVLMLIKKGKGRKEAVSIIAKQYGLSKKELYDKSLEK
ncbi:MAG: 16S rRNA (cytidine(1402)-2'-O)-methyltransferase [Dissulfurispiraceae bacterium]|jgi:16S rRNA (cytidine1402-2'-O)-methyltransferase|nr:16S rRNA (cytidine(1402)-2'-O)-methyltransferase [Dissulfurispiraceae bacterium]